MHSFTVTIPICGSQHAIWLYPVEKESCQAIHFAPKTQYALMNFPWWGMLYWSLSYLFSFSIRIILTSVRLVSAHNFIFGCIMWPMFLIAGADSRINLSLICYRCWFDLHAVPSLQDYSGFFTQNKVYGDWKWKIIDQHNAYTLVWMDLYAVGCKSSSMLYDAINRQEVSVVHVAIHKSCGTKSARVKGPRQGVTKWKAPTQKQHWQNTAIGMEVHSSSKTFTAIDLWMLWLINKNISSRCGSLQSTGLHIARIIAPVMLKGRKWYSN